MRALPAAGLALLAGCTPVSERFTGRYLDQPEVREMAAEPLRTVARGDAFGAQLNLSGRAGAAPGAAFGSAMLALGRLPVPEAERYLERLRDRLLAGWPYAVPQPRPRIELTGSRATNAAALPDGTIAVSLGTITRAESEDAVAFVLGHEMSHLLLRHQQRRQDQTQAMENLSEAMGQLAILGGALSSARVSQAGGATQVQGATSAGSRQFMLQAALGQVAAGEAVVVLADPGWNRRQEEQADLLGLDLASNAGYDPGAARAVFQGLVEQQARAREQAEPLGAQLLALYSASGGSGNASLTQFLGAAVPKLYGSARRSLADQHPEPADRLAWAENYSTRLAPPGRAAPRGGLDALRAQAGWRRAVVALNRARESHEAREEGSPAQALRAAQEAVAAAPDWWGAHYTLGLALKAGGQAAAGRAALHRALRQPGAPYPAHALAAQEAAQAGDRIGALALLDQAGQEFGSRELVLPDRIALQTRLGDREGAAADLAACGRAGNPRLREKCREAADTQARPAEGAGGPLAGGLLYPRPGATRP